MEQEVFGDFLGPQPDETTSQEANDFRPYKYYYVRFIARGGFGATYKVKRSSDNAIFALKITPPTSDMELKLLDRASQHFGVPRLVDAALFRGRAQLQVMEYCDGGDLSHSIRIQSRMASPFTEEVVKSILVQLALTLHHLHVKLRMLHRDIKASNVLLCHSGLVKLGDFGLSKSAQQASTFCGTLSHMAPEVVMRSVYDTKADIWSLGIVLYNVLTFEKPFSDTDDIETMKRRYAEAADDVRLIADFTKVKGTFSPDLIYLCEQMLRLDPQNRPSAADLLASPLLAPEVERFPALVMSSSSLPEEVRLSVLSSLVDDGFCAMETLPPSLQDALNRPTLQPLVLNSDAEYLSSPALGSPRSVIPTPCGQSSSSAVIFSSLAWKASGGKFRVRCMVLSPVHVILIDIDAETAQRLAMDPKEMAAAAAFSSTSTKLKLSALRDCVAQEPIAGPSPAGQGTVDAPEILYPLRFIRTDDKEWSISVASQEQQTQWVLELTKAREREARRQNAVSRARVGDEPVTSVSL